MDYDLIVVGAGPAGSSAALEAARRGLRVALLDRAAMPRHKPCGGCLPAGRLRQLPAGCLQGCWTAPVGVVATSYRGRHTRRFARRGAGPGTLVSVDRRAFDAGLAAAAAAAGADLRTLCRVTTLDEDADGVAVTVADRSGGGSRLRARWVIGADGATGIVRRHVPGAPAPPATIAIEADIPYGFGAGMPLPPDGIHFGFGGVPGGYAWAFAKGDHVNIGAGWLQSALMPHGPEAARRLREAATDLARGLGVPEADLPSRWSAHPFSLYRPGARVSPAGRVMLVGDAAGLMGPMFADGIDSAILSGRAASRAVAQGRPRQYARNLAQGLERRLAAEAAIAPRFYALVAPLAVLGFADPVSITLLLSRFAGRPGRSRPAPQAG